MASLTINSHSVATPERSDAGWHAWFWVLKLELWLFQIPPDQVVWTFDDFYVEEEQSLALLEKFGFYSMVVLYCPGLLGRSDAREALRNPRNLCSIGGSEELVAIAKRFTGLRVGVHSYLHRNYEQALVEELDSDMRHCKTFHSNLFGKPPMLFAFPYGRAHSDCIEIACHAFDTVYLSDNRIPYTEGDQADVVNRVHLELGGNLAKFLLKILLSRYRRLKNRWTSDPLTIHQHPR